MKFKFNLILGIYLQLTLLIFNYLISPWSVEYWNVRGWTTAAKQKPSTSTKYQTKAPTMASAISSTASPISLFRQLKQKPVELHTSSSLPITGRKTRGRRRYLHLCLASSSKPIIELEFLSVILFRIGIRNLKLF